MAKYSGEAINKICHDIERYRSLRRHQECPDSDFNVKLKQLQAWQKSRMWATHEPILDSQPKSILMNFILDELYIGLDLSCLGENFETAISIALKLVSRHRTLTSAFEFNALTAELDDKITQCIFEDLGSDVISNSVYVQANLLVNTRSDRARQVALLSELVDGLDKAMQSALVYGAFKLAKTPAKVAGLGKLYELAERGYTALRSVKTAENLIAELMQSEHGFYEKMFLNHEVEYNFLVPALVSQGLITNVLP